MPILRNAHKYLQTFKFTPYCFITIVHQRGQPPNHPNSALCTKNDSMLGVSFLCKKFDYVINENIISATVSSRDSF